MVGAGAEDGEDGGSESMCGAYLHEPFASPDHSFDDAGGQQVVEGQLHGPKGHSGPPGDFPLLERVCGRSEHSHHRNLAPSPQNGGDRIVKSGGDWSFWHT